MRKKVYIIVITSAVLLAAIAGILMWKNNEMKKEKLKTQQQEEAKKIEEKKQITQEENIDMSDWKTYRNEEYGFEFKYPKESSVNPKSESENIIITDGEDEHGHWLYNIEIISNVTNLSLDDTVEIMQNFKIKGEISNINIGNKPAKEFSIKGYSDYGNSNILALSPNPTF